ncbi:RNA-directed DNA polymerase, eukaryota, reverse transcriptase zinc-binding domain protein [Tanacetum coccineum]
MEGDNSGHKVQDAKQESVTKNNLPLNSYKNDTERSTCSCLAQKAKRDWVRELCEKHKVNFMSLQETKMEDIEHFNIKLCWGNFGFEFVHSPSVGNSGELREKKMLWDNLILVLKSWNGDVIIMGDFNEVRTQDERHGSIFNAHGVDAFNLFISSVGLEEVPLDGDPIRMHITCFMKKMKYLKEKIHMWVKANKENSKSHKQCLQEELSKIDLLLDKEEGSSTLIFKRMEILKSIRTFQINTMGLAQKANIKGAIEGDEKNSDVIIRESTYLDAKMVARLILEVLRLVLLFKFLNLFYADDAVFMGHWSEANIDTILRVLDCFYHASGLRINMLKSKLIGISVSSDKVDQAAKKIGCAILQVPFSYLGSKVGCLMSRIQSVDSKNISVALKLSHDDLLCSFRRAPRAGAEELQYIQLVKIMEVVSSKTRWIKAVPIKVNIHAWKIKLDILPTRLNISKRGMDIDSILCPLCEKECGIS